MTDPTETIELDNSPSAIASVYKEIQNNVKSINLNLSICTGLGLYTAVVALVLSYITVSPPELITYTSSETNGVLSITPHRNPPHTDRQAMHFASDKVCDLLSLHFKKYAEQIRRRENYFIGDGWRLYQLSLINNKTIETIKKQGLIVTAVNESKPRLLAKYLLDGKVNWKIEMKILQTIVGSSDKPLTKTLTVAVTLEEARRDDAYEGYKIRLFGVQG